MVVCWHIEAGLHRPRLCPDIKINGAYYRQNSYSPWCVRHQGNFFRLSTGQFPSTLAPDTVRLLEQRRRSFHRIFGQQTALTLIQLITGSGASSNSECTSRWCTTLTNWNSVQQVWRNVDQSIADNALTSGTSVFVHACRRKVDTSSICCKTIRLSPVNCTTT